MAIQDSLPDVTGVERFERFVATSRIDATIIDTGSHTLTVGQAAAALAVSEDKVIKTLLFHDGNGNAVIAITNGANRVDAALLANAAGSGPLKLAKPQMVLDILGYPAGGVPPIALPPDIPVIIDTNAAALETCVAGAGSITHLARIAMADIRRFSEATVAPITVLG